MIDRLTTWALALAVAFSAAGVASSQESVDPPATVPGELVSPTFQVVFTNADPHLFGPDAAHMQGWEREVSRNMEAILLGQYPFLRRRATGAAAPVKGTPHCVLRVNLHKELAGNIGKLFLELRLDDRYGLAPGETLAGRPAVLEQDWPGYPDIVIPNGAFPELQEYYDLEQEDPGNWSWPADLPGRGKRDGVLKNFEADIREKQETFVQRVIARVPLVYRQVDLELRALDPFDLSKKSIVLGLADERFADIPPNSHLALGWRFERFALTFWNFSWVSERSKVAQLEDGGAQRSGAWFLERLSGLQTEKSDKPLDAIPEAVFGKEVVEAVADGELLVVHASEASAPVAQKLYLQSVHGVVTKWGRDFQNEPVRASQGVSE